MLRTNVARARKKHIQQELVYWGGKRKGAGRPPKNRRSSERHKVRPELKAVHPLHVTLRVEKVIGTLRTRSLYYAVRRALRTVLVRDDFRVIDVSLPAFRAILAASLKASLASGLSQR